METPDRIHFKQFGAFSLDYECVYYISSADYNAYMNAQQENNLKIAQIPKGQNRIRIPDPDHPPRQVTPSDELPHPTPNRRP